MQRRGTSPAAHFGALLAFVLFATGCAQVPVVSEADFNPHPAVAQREYHPDESVRIDAAEPEMDPAIIQPGNLFDRIREGFVLADVSHTAVQREVEWYARHPDYLDRTFRRGERYLHYIVEELEARGMPMELSLLPIVESAFNPVAYSRARASGLWQFIPGTGIRYGLKQNWYYDGRRDIVESTRAALDYLTFLANEFDGDWLLAVAAYNTGEANVARRIAANRKAGRPTDFFSLDLPRETRMYVPKLLAMREIVANPARYNLQFAPIADRPYFAIAHTGGQIQLDVAREIADITEEEFLALNPGFKHGVTDPEGPHRLLVPVSQHERLMSGIANLPPQERIRVVNHRVRSGETLGSIARRYSLSVDALRSANNLKGNTIRVGQDLVVTEAPARTVASTSPSPVRSAPALALASSESVGKRGTHVVKQGETLWSIAQSYGVGVEALVSHNDLSRSAPLSVGKTLSIPPVATLAAAGPAASAPQPVTYTVRAGDTLSQIARNFQVGVADLRSWNNLRSSQVLKPGQRLVMYLADPSRIGG